MSGNRSVMARGQGRASHGLVNFDEIDLETSATRGAARKASRTRQGRLSVRTVAEPSRYVKMFIGFINAPAHRWSMYVPV